MRINRYLAMAGVTSRRKAEEYILSGRVELNGEIVLSLATLVDPSIDEIALDGETLRSEEKVYFVLNKPTGYITSVSDDKNRPTVIDLIKTNKRIFPVGRLDYDTTGVLLLSNDGDFANALLHPSNKVMRTYEVKLDKPFENNHLEPLLKGISIEGGKGKFHSVKIDKKNPRFVTVECTEGRNLFVKRMFRKVGYYVEKLHRSKFAGFTVEGLKYGAWKNISRQEIQNALKKYNHL
ncbi:MAG: rRNA pseudouridine synthase [Ignavibacteriaceae bacterium]|nr:MAG: rRNA pseudouridine synthase [Ignavibacteriaceae bacterium]MBW7872349.1 rRNA pseudouridine synthase [Ignavibacteria bacterium]MBZ0197671.1 rRNA pseudouridine synthase [Ignavibacteriaceae bacterium]OQY71643.1 MAG: pseudouridine synthase [Ignavibacteriales bacterium UTCHB3]